MPISCPYLSRTLFVDLIPPPYSQQPAGWPAGKKPPAVPEDWRSANARSSGLDASELCTKSPFANIIYTKSPTPGASENPRSPQQIAQLPGESANNAQVPCLQGIASIRGGKYAADCICGDYYGRNESTARKGYSLAARTWIGFLITLLIDSILDWKVVHLTYLKTLSDATCFQTCIGQRHGWIKSSASSLTSTFRTDVLRNLLGTGAKNQDYRSD